MRRTPAESTIGSVLGVEDALGEVERDGEGAAAVAHQERLGDGEGDRQGDDERGALAGRVSTRMLPLRRSMARRTTSPPTPRPGYRTRGLARREARDENQVFYRGIGERRVGVE